MKARPVSDYDRLRERVFRLLKQGDAQSDPAQMQLKISASLDASFTISQPGTIGAFFSYLTVSLPYAEIYLFGGVLRDLALFGRKGFKSDFDLVVVGDWQACAELLESHGASRNKFGGYRLWVGGWPVDIWSARETWAIKKGFVPWGGVSSLLRTTVLNWDAILMNLRSGVFLAADRYLKELQERYLDVVLVENPNPLGMTVRVLRHLCMKDARKISVRAALFLSGQVKRYSYEELVSKEIKSYGAAEIDKNTFEFFSVIARQPIGPSIEAYRNAENLFSSGVLKLPLRQFDLAFEIERDVNNQDNREI